MAVSSSTPKELRPLAQGCEAQGCEVQRCAARRAILGLFR